MPFLQKQMIKSVKSMAMNDDAISAALMYGSFIKGEGDQFSDIEFYIFYHKDFDHKAWVNQIAPLSIFFKNEFGTEVAIFNNLIRGEFHFAPVSEINVIYSWQGMVSFEYAEKMTLVDKDGRLAKILAELDRQRPRHDHAEYINWLAKSFINNFLMIGNLIKRGEDAHAQMNFQYLQKYLLYMIRLDDGADNHWESPSKKLESEISSHWYAAYKECVPSLSHNALTMCLENAAKLAKKLFKRLQVKAEFSELLDSALLGQNPPLT